MSSSSLALKEETLEKEIPSWVFDILEDETPDRRFWITKGLGSGGTYGLAIWHYSLCLLNYKSKISWSIAPTFQQVADTLIPTFLEVLTTVFELKEGQDFEVVTSGRPRITLKKTKQEIHFKSANRPDRMVGANVSHISATECGLWGRMAYEKSSARLRCPRALRRQYLGEGTPEGFNWWEKEANFEEGINELKNAVRLILHTADNVYLPSGYVKMLEETYSYDPAKLASYLFGLFVSFNRGTAYWEFYESRNVKLDLRASPLLPIVFSWDFGKSPLSTVYLQYQPFQVKNEYRKKIIVLGEGDGKARGVLDACADFVDWVSTLEGGLTAYKNTAIHLDGGHDGYFSSHLTELCAYDQATQYLRKYFNNVITVAERAAPLVKDRLERANAILAYERCIIAKWCRNTIESLSQTSLIAGTWQLDKKKGKRAGDDAWNDKSHFGDALTYAIFRLTMGEDLERPSRKRTLGINT